MRLMNLQPHTTYYYTVDSMDARGTSDGVENPVEPVRRAIAGSPFVQLQLEPEARSKNGQVSTLGRSVAAS